MLINLSNHPSTNWSEAQLNAAAKYGSISDLAFPHINPAATTDEIRMLVDHYISQVRAMDAPATVHIMGEFTFCYLFVSACKAIGMPCVAATTNRMVQEQDGKKIVSFEFVQFRPFF